MESSSKACPHSDAAAVCSNKLCRGMKAVYLVLVKKHQPKLAALGVHLHHLLSRSKRRSSLATREQNPALMSLSSSLSCRSMDPAAAVCKYQYRPREVEFSCKSTPMHRRRREDKRRLRLQSRAAEQRRDRPLSEPEYYGSAAAVTRLFALMDVEEVAEAADGGYDGSGDLDLDLDDAAVAAWSAPRQVRITDSPYLPREEDNEERSAVDRRADEFIMWFHEQLRTQQQQQRSTRNWGSDKVVVQKQQTDWP